MPVLIGSAMAAVHGRIDPLLFAAMIVASVLIQSGVNMFNEYFDFKRGLDTTKSVGIGGVIVNREINAESVLNIASASFGVSVLLGAYICLRTSWWVAVAGSASMAVGYLYSGGPFPLAYSLFGELAAGIFMGPMIVMIAFFVQSGSVTTSSFLLSIPIALLVAGILLANNIRDFDGDRKEGRKTIAVRYGQGKAINLLAVVFALSFVSTMLLTIAGLATPWILISLASIPKAIQSIRIFHRGRNPVEMMAAMKASSVLHSQFGILFSLGLLLGKLILSF
jgi:1,4-dihydroxy-2-naphthoate octaprenyltransferase